MKQSYHKSLILIVITATALIVAQGYFTVRSYKMSKQRFVSDVRQALDLSIENYFAGKARSDIYVLSSEKPDTLMDPDNLPVFGYGLNKLDSIVNVVRSSKPGNTLITRIQSGSKSLAEMNLNHDSIFHLNKRRSVIKSLKLTSKLDTVRARALQLLTQKVMVSISEDPVDLHAVYSELRKELDKKQLDIDFALSQESLDGKTAIGVIGANYLSEAATSAFLGDLHSIKVYFENATLIILREGIGELVLSILLVGLVIGTLAHLYLTIGTQKQLAEIKDDLISNITHEFKTPIATIFSALEGVTNFNQSNDREKTHRYLKLSTDQLQKLNDMVEKMLETATLDQGRLTLNKEEVEVTSWTREIVKQFQLVATKKQVSFETNLGTLTHIFDRLHLENALSNLLDNAIKYGGNHIVVRLDQKRDALVWEVEDDGGNIPPAQQNKVFEKLYRIPTGNQHDVKGFGIGLHYARTITEMHGGMLTLTVSDRRTSFKLIL